MGPKFSLCDGLAWVGSVVWWVGLKKLDPRTTLNRLLVMSKLRSWTGRDVNYLNYGWVLGFNGFRVRVSVSVRSVPPYGLFRRTYATAELGWKRLNGMGGMLSQKRPMWI